MKEIIISYPKVLFKLTCPRCQDTNSKAIDVQRVTCQKCNLKYTPDLKGHITSQFSYPIQRALTDDNEVRIYAQTRYKEAVYEFYTMYLKQGNWDVTKPKIVWKMNIRVSCEQCAFCKNCVTCASCNETYEAKNKKCPFCGSYKKKKTYIRKTKRALFCQCGCQVKPGLLSCPECGSKNIKECPTCERCGSNNIEPTAFKDVKECPLCGSNAISKREKYEDYELIIKRLNAFRIENLRVEDGDS